MAPDTRVNCVAPGFVPTHFSQALLGNEAVVSIFLAISFHPIAQVMT